MTRASDASMMARALAWARRGTGSTYPNPCVGAVIVARGEIVGAAHSAATGGAHAEVRALAKAGARARGATLFVTLEPCSHTGRTGPCTDAIIAAGIAKVVLAIRDPAKHAAGRGIAKLQRAGVQVVEGVGAEDASRVHAHYLHHVAHGTPFVTLKAAIGLDGRLAVRSGESKWITGTKARTDAHRLRAEHHAIAVGVGTLLADDPALDVRLVRGVSPLVVVLDTRLRCVAPGVGPRNALREGTLVLHGSKVGAAALRRVRATGAEPIAIATDRNGHVDVRAALRELGRREIRSLLVEGGGEVHGAFVAAQLWQRLVLYQAPLLLGDGPGLLGALGFERMKQAPRVQIIARRSLGDDERIECIPLTHREAAPPPPSRTST
ncbi:MAG TPA: bifunctional diaminohydroxyphosphoribosylaminopyrimidine deaminase/5-amino-6-(5-phosphoribosylamino)uracil reductase RibD [Nannocystaceae bacterium]|nr:bifunctional diaminohydroxyphosphoribosylaminopyrimidine deaminase/5-amino-6-(5-phosphoribosylamino)uracil reductase RibD [Nannocystaceae bacterium]